MNYKNNENIGKLIFLSAVAYGAYKTGKYIENTYFKDKTEEDINILINNAFKKLDAYVNLAKDSSELLKNAVNNLQNGYNNLSSDNINPETINKLISIVDNLETITNKDPEITSSIEIIGQSLEILQEKIK